jgi:outer membrane protein assembly factor BamB
MPTPVVHDGRLYVLKNQGILTAWDLKTGQQLYEQRLSGVTSGFSASPVVADGKLYLPSEDGDVLVVRAGPKFELIATNPMGQPLMATPAISGGLLLVRGERDLFAVGSVRRRAQRDGLREGGFRGEREGHRSRSWPAARAIPPR